jgi:hypothetical protein
MLFCFAQATKRDFWVCAHLSPASLLLFSSGPSLMSTVYHLLLFSASHLQVDPLSGAFAKYLLE